MSLITNEQARYILQRIADGTRRSIAELAAQEGVNFDSDNFSDADILRAMLNAAGIEQLFDEAGASGVIDQLPALLEGSSQ